MICESPIPTQISPILPLTHHTPGQVPAPTCAQGDTYTHKVSTIGNSVKLPIRWRTRRTLRRAYRATVVLLYGVLTSRTRPTAVY